MPTNEKVVDGRNEDIRSDTLSTNTPPKEREILADVGNRDVIRSLSKEELVVRLESDLSSIVLNKMKDEEIDGEVFCHMLKQPADSHIFLRLGIPYGKAYYIKKKFSSMISLPSLKKEKPSLDAIKQYTPRTRLAYTQKRTLIGIQATRYWNNEIPSFTSPEMKLQLKEFAESVVKGCAVDKIGFGVEGIMEHTRTYFTEQRRSQKKAKKSSSTSSSIHISQLSSSTDSPGKSNKHMNKKSAIKPFSRISTSPSPMSSNKHKYTLSRSSPKFNLSTALSPAKKNKHNSSSISTSISTSPAKRKKHNLASTTAVTTSILKTPSPNTVGYTTETPSSSQSHNFHISQKKTKKVDQTKVTPIVLKIMKNAEKEKECLSLEELNTKCSKALGKDVFDKEDLATAIRKTYKLSRAKVEGSTLEQLMVLLVQSIAKKKNKYNKKK